VRATVTELLQALLQLHGDGLARLLRIIAQRDIGMLDVLTRDTVVAHLLLLHGLHPVPVEKRVVRALEEVRPLLQSQGGNVELLGIETGVARLRLQGSRHGCLASAMPLKLAIEEAIQKVAPDLEGLEIEFGGKGHD
jgi:Fe-S cluster biogenesis protein NfuA